MHVSDLDPTSRSLLLSQGGPGGAAALTTSPPQRGVLVRRAAALERAATAICFEGGVRVAANVLLRDMIIGTPLTDRAASPPHCSSSLSRAATPAILADLTQGARWLP